MLGFNKRFFVIKPRSDTFIIPIGWFLEGIKLASLDEYLILNELVDKITVNTKNHKYTILYEFIADLCD